ncbi:MAG: SGNH/GDSL hydrolase family protein [Candidatus Solibacter usitatus]|nr:SGNH/GDSL hydrolase family protein [Candidatus Solibacter usitatus]
MNFAMTCKLALAVCLASIGAAQQLSLKDGDTVVFYGDSITDQRLYTTFAETYLVTRFPTMHFTFVHSGWGGDKVSGGGGGPIDLRLRRDVIAYHPTVVTIMLGMNDGRSRPFDQGIFQEFASGYEKIVRDVKTALPEVRITAIQPSPFDDVTREPNFEGGYNAVLMRYAAFIKELANREHLAVADLNTPVVAMLQRARAQNAALSQKIIPDRVHPGPSGHLIMAAALLKAWNAPALVSDVEIDSRTGKATRSENAEVTGIANSNGLRWLERDRALPMPVDWKDETLTLAVRSSDFLAALNQEKLRVTGLSDGSYVLKIDAETVGTFGAAQLAGGINLAEWATPMAKQAADAHKLTLQHNNLHFARWRMVQVPLDGLGFLLTPAESSLDSLERQVILAQRIAVQPKPHLYELTRAQ